MRRLTRRVLAVVAAACTVMALSAVPAFAIRATVVIGGNPVQCTVTVGGPGGTTGSIAATYTDSSDLFDLSGGDLEVQTAAGPGCGSLATVGDALIVAGQYQVFWIHHNG